MSLMMVDTSSWVHLLRKNGDPQVRQRVERLLQSDTAAWCEIVQLEIWMGCGNAQERQHLREMMALVPCLSIDGDVWAEAFRLAERSRNAGLRIPANDILIAACARVHEVFVESADKHFDLLAKL